MTDDIRKLLGGYATGTLTEAERKALFDAAIEDQQLFETLADEQALKELVEDPASRAQLLRSTEDVPFSMAAVLRDWIERPRSKALLGVAAVLVVAVTVTELRKSPPQQIAQVNAVRLEAPSTVTPERVPAEQQNPAPAAVARRVKQKAEAPARLEQPSESGALPQSAPTSSFTAFSTPPPPAPAATRPAAVAESFTRVATDGKLELRYTVLLKNEKGEYLPVPADHAFNPEDRARLRVETNETGFLLISRPQTEVATAPVQPGRAVIFPQAGDLTFERENATIELAFSRTPEVQRVYSRFSSDVAQLRSAENARAKAAPARMPEGAVLPSDSLQVRIVLRRK